MRSSLLCLLVFSVSLLHAEEEGPSFFGIPTNSTPANKLPAPADTIKKAEAEVTARPLPPELETIRESISKGEQVMDDIFNKRMADLRAAFIAETQKASAKAEAEQKPLVVKFMKRRLDELAGDGPMILTFLPTEPPEWQALVKTGRQALEAWRQQYEQQAAKLSAMFRQQLKQASMTFVEKKQPEDAAKAAQMARGLQSWLTLRGRVWASGVERSASFGGEGGSRFQHVVKEGGVLVGFQFTEKKHGNSNIIGSLTPVYMTSQGQVLGPMFGKPKSGAEVKKVIALDGYAVAGIIPTTGDRLDGFRVIFMRMKQNEAGLDPKFRYVSDYLGGKGGSPHPACGDDGRLVVGIWGRHGGDIDAAGLILLDKTK